MGLGNSTAPVRAQARRTITLLPLVAATYFMVAGGPYGLEELVQKAGYSRTLLILLITPLIWSLPTALMVGELSSAVPKEGGYYVWVRRAIGPFWGFQEAWLTLIASVFDMAIYPTIFVLYLSRLWPAADGRASMILLGAAMLAACTAWNLRGARAVGNGSVWMMAALLAPFAIVVGYAFASRAAPGFWPALGFSSVVPGASPGGTTAATGGATDLLGGILIAMWNYMGWDCASTVAGEVERPQRTYPLALLISVALVSFTYLLPVSAAAWAGIDPAGWSTGAWSEVAGAVAGHKTAVWVSLGGIVCGIGMFNALMMSNTRLPLVMAEDGLLPAIFARRDARTGAPWVAILACAVAWAACLGLGFQRLVALDVLLYGLGLLLEFVALVVLRIREPGLPRPFRVPGGLIGATLVGIGPLLLLGLALVRDRGEQVAGINALVLGLILVAAGPILYFIQRSRSVTSDR